MRNVLLVFGLGLIGSSLACSRPEERAAKPAASVTLTQASGAAAEPATSAAAIGTAPALAAKSKDDALVDRVAAELDKRGRASKCLTFSVDGAEVEVREKHAPPCPGDPATSPVMGRFRLDDKGAVVGYDVADDKWTSLDAVLGATSTAPLSLEKAGLAIQLDAPSDAKAAKDPRALTDIAWVTGSATRHSVIVTLGASAKNARVAITEGTADVNALLGPTIADSEGACKATTQNQRLGVYRCKSRRGETFGVLADVDVAGKHFACEASDLPDQAAVDRVLTMCRSMRAPSRP